MYHTVIERVDGVTYICISSDSAFSKFGLHYVKKYRIAGRYDDRLLENVLFCNALTVHEE